MDKLQAVHTFWAGFTWPAYDENSVPDYAEPPYITHESSVDEFNRPIAQMACLYTRSSGWTEIIAKEKEIADAITSGGKIIHYDNGAFIIRKASPWAQRAPSEAGDTIRREILNYEIEYLE